MAEKEASPKKSTPAKKAAVKKAPAKKALTTKAPASKKVQEHVTVEDMHRLLGLLEDGLSSRDKVVDHLRNKSHRIRNKLRRTRKLLPSVACSTN